MHSAVEEIWYEGERLAANHARGHNLIHPEVAGGTARREQPKGLFRLAGLGLGRLSYLLFFFFVPPASNRCLGQRLE